MCLSRIKKNLLLWSGHQPCDLLLLFPNEHKMGCCPFIQMENTQHEKQHGDSLLFFLLSVTWLEPTRPKSHWCNSEHLPLPWAPIDFQLNQTGFRNQYYTKVQALLNLVEVSCANHQTICIYTHIYEEAHLQTLLCTPI